MYPVIPVPNYMYYYSFTDPWGTDGWVGHVGWPIADGLTTKWSPIQLSVWRRIGKVRRPRPSFQPLCYAANSIGPKLDFPSTVVKFFKEILDPVTNAVCCVILRVANGVECLCEFKWEDVDEMVRRQQCGREQWLPLLLNRMAWKQTGRRSADLKGDARVVDSVCDRTRYLSSERGMTEVTEMGLKSLGRVGLDIFGMGKLTVVFHWRGTKPSVSDWLNSWARVAAKIGALRLRNQAVSYKFVQSSLAISYVHSWLSRGSCIRSSLLVHHLHSHHLYLTVWCVLAEKLLK